MSERIMVNEECLELARKFLRGFKGSTERDIWALAKMIEDAYEEACRRFMERRGHGSIDMDEERR